MFFPFLNFLYLLYHKFLKKSIIDIKQEMLKILMRLFVVFILEKYLGRFVKFRPRHFLYPIAVEGIEIVFSYIGDFTAKPSSVSPI